MSLLKSKGKTIVIFPGDYDPDVSGLPASLTPEWKEAHEREVVVLSLDSDRPSHTKTVRVARQIERWKATFPGGGFRHCHLDESPRPLNGDDLQALAATRRPARASEEARRDAAPSDMQKAEYWATVREKYRPLRSDWRRFAALGVNEKEVQTFFLWLDVNGSMAEVARQLNAQNRGARYTRQTVQHRLRAFSRKTGIALDTRKQKATKAPLFDKNLTVT